MTEPRIVPPNEAREILATPLSAHARVVPLLRALAHTAAVLGEQVLEFQKTQDAMCRDMDYFETQMEKARADRDALGEQRDAALALHWPVQAPGVNFAGDPWDPYCGGCHEECGYDAAPTYPCRTARALGVTDV